jgi:hypothetical protein
MKSRGERGRLLHQARVLGWGKRKSIATLRGWGTCTPEIDANKVAPYKLALFGGRPLRIKCMNRSVVY